MIRYRSDSIVPGTNPREAALEAVTALFVRVALGGRVSPQREQSACGDESGSWH